MDNTPTTSHDTTCHTECGVDDPFVPPHHIEQPKEYNCDEGTIRLYSIIVCCLIVCCVALGIHYMTPTHHSETNTASAVTPTPTVEHEPKFTHPLSDDMRAVAYGDSTMACGSIRSDNKKKTRPCIDDEDTWVKNSGIINKSVAGNTTDDVIAQVGNTSVGDDINTVFVTVGSNDFRYRRSVEYVRRNMWEIVRSIDESFSNVNTVVFVGYLEVDDGGGENMVQGMNINIFHHMANDVMSDFSHIYDGADGLSMMYVDVGEADIGDEIAGGNGDGGGAVAWHTTGKGHHHISTIIKNTLQKN